MTSTTELKHVIDTKDYMGLRKLSNEYGRQAISEQTDDLIKLAMIAYCMNKVLSKAHFAKKSDKLLYYVREKLEKNDLKGTLDSIEEFDKLHGLFQGTLVGKARIKIGARLYSNGLSMTQAASLAGARISDILRYSGGTKSDVAETRSVMDRLDVARKLFKV